MSDSARVMQTELNDDIEIERCRSTLIGQASLLIVESNEAAWQWVMVLPLLTPNNEKDFRQNFPDPINTAKRLFRPRAWETFQATHTFKGEMGIICGDDGIVQGTKENGPADTIGIKPGYKIAKVHSERPNSSPRDFYSKTELESAEKSGLEYRVTVSQDLFKKEMTKLEFHEAARMALGQLISSQGAEMDTMFSIDEDEVLLMIKMSETKTIEHIAHECQWLMPVAHTEYRHGRCPTSKLDPDSDEFKGEDCYPLHDTFDVNHPECFQKFRDIDILRMAWLRICQIIAIEEMEKEGIILNFFPVHHPEKLQDLMDTRWCDISAFWQLPSTQPLQAVRDYFGEEFAFFYIWLTFYTQMLRFPAVGGVLFYGVLWLSPYLTTHEKLFHEILYVFAACLMVLWSEVFIKSYMRQENMKIEQWGMTNFHLIVRVRAEFSIQKRGSLSEILKQGAHWLLALTFVFETLFANYYLTQIYATALDRPDATYYGLKGRYVIPISKATMSLHVKIMSFLWYSITPALSAFENHRTNHDLKFAVVLKLVVVNIFIYFYPCWYLAFLKSHAEGCSAQGCLEELRQYLVFFFVVHILWVLATIILPFASTWWAVHAELRDEKAAGKIYTSLEVQAKRAEYRDETDDFMELAFSCGFVMMFSVVNPLLGIIAFACNMFEVRLLAWRSCFIFQRTDPKGGRGIGLWKDVLQMFVTLAALCNVALVAFVMEPCASLHYSYKITIFLALEHLLIALQALLAVSIPATSATLLRVQEVNAALHAQRGAHGAVGEVKRFPPPKRLSMSPSSDERFPLSIKNSNE